MNLYIASMAAYDTRSKKIVHAAELYHDTSAEMVEWSCRGYILAAWPKPRYTNVSIIVEESPKIMPKPEVI